MISSLVRALAITLALTVAAQAGTLDHGTWAPADCGPEPVAPAGLNLSSSAAFNESVKWVKLYQEQYNSYSQCMIKEANADNAAINSYVQRMQSASKKFFDKVSEDYKRAQATLSGKSDGGDGSRHGHGKTLSPN